MCPRIAIVYNEPAPSRYTTLGESVAIAGVVDEALAVNNALVELGYQTTMVPLSPPLETQLSILQQIDADLVFNLFEGFDGCPETEAVVAGMISKLGFRFTGCPTSAIAIALDKARSKHLLNESNILTPEFHLVTTENLHSLNFHYPSIVKPQAEDASHGISEDSVAHDFDSLKKRVHYICDLYGGSALVEEYIDGREFNVCVLERAHPFVLPISEIVYTLPQGLPNILTFSAKWEPTTLYYQCSQVVCPADLDKDLLHNIEKTSLRVFEVFECASYARIDFRLSHNGSLYVIDINPNPDISLTSGAAHQAAVAGIDYPRFIENIVLSALGVTIS